jgi:hypothetical protein
MRISAAALSAILLATGMAAGHAETLQGQFTGSAEMVCLNSANGFDANLQPNDPNRASISTRSVLGLLNFNGSGGGTESSTEVATSTPVKVSASSTPQANSSQSSGAFTDTVGAGNVVTITTSNLSGTFLTGPETGETFVVDQVVMSGFLSPDGSTLILASPTTNIETATLSTGKIIQRVCHRSGVFVLNPPANPS